MIMQKEIMMLRANLTIATLIALLLAPLAMADDLDHPTIGILSFGPTAGINLGLKGTLDMLQAYGYFNEDERAMLDARQDLEGENVNILWRSAGFDVPSINLMTEDVLDRGVDVMLTLNTQVSQIAVTATREMAEPPPIVFMLVAVPYDAGLAEDSCVKTPNVTGTFVSVDFDKIASLLQVQDPDIQVIGTIVTPDQPPSVASAKQIQAAGEALGLTVAVASAIAPTDLDTAIASLIDSGAEAILYSMSTVGLRGMPVLVEKSIEYGIPLFGPVTNHVFFGVTVGAGFKSIYGEGVIAAQMLHAHLSGEMNVADIAINNSESFAVAINLDSAEAQGVVIATELLDMADYVIADGVASGGVTRELPELTTALPEMTAEQRQAADRAFLESLRCTPEIIAEQQAKLDAADA